MRKTKILGIAPYEGIDVLMNQAASKRNNIKFTSFIGDLEKGAEIASKYNINDFDIIISRGGTAELIKEHTHIPVIEIQLSIYDIFRSIKLAENYTKAYALVGFPSITKNAHFLCDMLQLNMNIKTINSESDVRDTLLELKNNGYQMILCDMLTNTLAKEYGLTSILITSGSESVEAAFDQAVHIQHNNLLQNEQYHFIKAILENSKDQIFVFNSEEELVFKSKDINIKSQLINAMKSKILQVLENGEERIYKKYSESLYTIDGIKKVINKTVYAIFYVSTKKEPANISKNGITYISKDETNDDFFSCYYAVSYSSRNLGFSVEEFAHSDSPIMVLGEHGSGIEQIVKLIHSKSKYQNKSMVIIDCEEMLSSKAWTYLMQHENSPFNDMGLTIYIKNIDSLSNIQFSEFIKLLSSLASYNKCKLIFSSRYTDNRNISIRYEQIRNTLSCLMVTIPPLREHSKDIPNLASLYISSLNVTTAKEIIGIEPEGLEILMNYNWPANYAQFIRIINELVILTDTPYIKTVVVEKVLKKETDVYTPIQTNLDLDRTLEEINYDIIKMQLHKNNGNQSSTAKQLGISRTTLWRILQKYE